MKSSDIRTIAIATAAIILWLFGLRIQAAITAIVAALDTQWS